MSHTLGISSTPYRAVVLSATYSSTTTYRSSDFTQTLLSTIPPRLRTERSIDLCPSIEGQTTFADTIVLIGIPARNERVNGEHFIISFFLRNKWRCLSTRRYTHFPTFFLIMRTLHRKLLRVRSHERTPPTCAMRSSTDIDVLQRFPLFADQLISVPAESRRQQASAQVALIKFDLCWIAREM